MISEQVNFVSIPRCASRSIHSLMGGDNDANHKSIRLTNDERFSFAVIRNPMRRLISWWKYHSTVNYDPTATIYGATFTDWVLRGCPHHWSVKDCDNMGISSPLNQWEFVCDSDGTIIVDRLIDYDNLQIEFDIVLCPYISNTTLPELNKSTIESVSISIGVQQIIMDLYQKDYDIYNKLNK